MRPASKQAQADVLYDWIFCVCLFAAEVHGTENPLTRRPIIDPFIWLESAVTKHVNRGRAKMRKNDLEDPRTPKAPQVRTEDLFLLSLFHVTTDAGLAAKDLFY